VLHLEKKLHTTDVLCTTSAFILPVLVAYWWQSRRGAAIPRVHYSEVPVTAENDRAAAAATAWLFLSVTGTSASN